MEINILNLRNSINKAYLKVKPNRTQIETFKKNITNLCDQIKESESEEFHKNIISEFLKNTYYSPVNYINTKGRYDLVIHNGKDSKSTVGVLFETKKPSNKLEMPTCENINCKAFQELILYYLRERITNKNLEIKHLIITNIFEWYIFNSTDFEKLFADDKRIVKQFIDFEEGRLSGTNTDFFYKNIAEPFVKEMESTIPVTYLDIKDFETIIKNADLKDDTKLVALYKILSPEHLLKLPFTNDSNNLDKTFYNELLHIIGLEETKDGSKKLIGRKIEKKRNPGSLIENSITILKYEDCLTQLPKLSDFGKDKEIQLFNISLELVITWINRILFLKLLEGQLIKYNNGDKSFRFLNIDKIHDFDELNKLFFQVLAVKESDRSEIIKHKFGNIPYLNSSLFEPSELEHKTIRINSLDDHSELPVLTGTILKDKTGRKLTGNIVPLQYLFEFLDSYDFSSEGSEDIQEENKTLINASVLGLIFEKINGYKEGSFFTPGFITMYMCQETIRRAVIQKFNEVKSWKCETISDVYNEIEDIKEANRIINSLRICDPAVGSGHFLVSALNEIIAIKSELRVLIDREGKKLKEYTVEVINDELIITDEQSKLFEYNPKVKESQRVQEALFQEKQRIIENCLFGVDINPNSVKICRLRLWIELLKNAYYKPDTNYKELETLPNIDINIKCGNSLISRYPLDADIKTALKSSKWTVDNYREAVMNYRNASSKEEKRTLENLILTIKNDFATEVSRTNQDVKALNKYKNELLQLTSSQLFEYDARERKDWNKRFDNLNLNIEKFELKISEIKNNKVFENSFEWRFEFPEVLNNEGEFIGFDVVIANPPYIQHRELAHISAYLKNNYSVYSGTSDISSYFFEIFIHILKPKGILTVINSNKFFNTEYGYKLRTFLSEFNFLSILNFEQVPIFDEALVSSVILSITKELPTERCTYIKLFKEKITSLKDIKTKEIFINQNQLKEKAWLFNDKDSISIINKIKSKGIPLGEMSDIEIKRGITSGYDAAFIIDKTKYEDIVEKEKNAQHILKKVLKGEHINRYEIKFNDLWIINSHNGIKDRYDRIDIVKDYPFIYDHFQDINTISKGKVENRSDKGFHWTNLRSCAFIDDFEKEKIVWGLISGKWGFAFDDEGFFLTSASYFLISKETNLKLILGLLNSKLFQYYFIHVGEYTAGGAYVLKKTSIEKIVLPKFRKNDQKSLIELVDLVLLSKKEKQNTLELEKRINKMVYKLYELTEEEISTVEK